ncbi:MAG: TetR/AcrR family transcriptional regulator [Bacteroidia bacterium]|nr:TetR/AcrR family transcriptional regulator [Bacteroidia bacterium]
MDEKPNKRKPGRPSEKQGVNLDGILRTALKSFAKNGFRGVSLNSLAKEVGVADSNLHYHFGSKEELWKSALNLIGGEIIKELDNLSRLIKDLDGIQQMKLFNKQIVYVSARYPEFQQIVVQEVFSKSDRSKWLIENLLGKIYHYMDTVRVEEQKKGRIKEIPSPNMTSFVIGSITTLFSRSYQMETLYNLNPFDEKEVERHADIINDLLFNGMLTRDEKEED